MQQEFKWHLDVLPMNPDSRDVRMILGNDYVDEIQRAAEARCRAQLAERIAAPLQNMVRRLSEPEGKFMDTLVTNVADIAALIPALNLTGDPRFDALQQQLETLTRHNAPTLRKSSSARNDTARQAQAILDQMSDFLEPSGGVSVGGANVGGASVPASRPDDTLDLMVIADLPLLAPVPSVGGASVPASRLVNVGGASVPASLPLPAWRQRVRR